MEDKKIDERLDRIYFQIRNNLLIALERKLEYSGEYNFYGLYDCAQMLHAQRVITKDEYYSLYTMSGSSLEEDRNLAREIMIQKIRKHDNIK